MKKGNLVKALAFLLAVLLLMAGCAGGATTQQSDTAATTGTEASSGGSTDSGDDSDVITVGMSFHSMLNDVFTASEKYLKQFGAESTPKVEFTITVADNDISKQAADVKDLISMSPDVIAIIPEDSRAVESSIIAAHEANLPVVVYNRPVNSEVAEQPESFIGIDSTDQGYASAKEVFQMMKDDGVEEINVILVSGDLNDENSVNRSNGVSKAAEEMGANILADLPSDAWDPTIAAANLAPALKAYPSANCIFVSSDGLLPGVQSALEDINRWIPYGEEGHMYMASCDCFTNGLEALADGYIDADSLFDIVTQSKKTIETIIALKNGEEVEPYVAVKGPVFTRDNYQDPEMQALLW